MAELGNPLEMVKELGSGGGGGGGGGTKLDTGIWCIQFIFIQFILSVHIWTINT